MSKEFECLDRIDKRNYLTEREHKEFLGVVEKAIKEYEAIKNAESTKAMECLETIWCDISTNYINEYVAIKQALQRLESIDNAEPNEVLECLNCLERLHDCGVFNYEEMEDYNTIKQALQRLESIDNSNPSEALECLERIEADLIGLPKHVTEYDDIFDDYLDDIENNIDTIKQALLKAQEPKQYLKWEDLEFKETHKIKILMNGNLYNLLCYDEKYIEIRTIKGEYMLTLDNDNSEDKQFFNDLHLERVKE